MPLVETVVVGGEPVVHAPQDGLGAAGDADLKWSAHLRTDTGAPGPRNPCPCLPTQPLTSITPGMRTTLPAVATADETGSRQPPRRCAGCCVNTTCGAASQRMAVVTLLASIDDPPT